MKLSMKSRSRDHLRANTSIRLASYLAAGIGASVLGNTSSEAAIINIDISDSGFNIDGVNAGLSEGSKITKNNFPLSGGGSLVLSSNGGDEYTATWGMYGRFETFPHLIFATANSGLAKPTRFSSNATIGSTAFWGNYVLRQVFRVVSSTYYGSVTYSSPDFGAGSYLGFKTGTGNYGWLEATWANATSRFQIYSGAYESTVGLAIAAGATAQPEPTPPSSVPEPSTSLMALVAGGAAFMVWRKRREQARKIAV
jgi:hypothetical protein